jgi:thiol-disulfide isomerase/thioredoxin
MRFIFTCLLFSINFILLFDACSDNTDQSQQKVDPMESALPHGTTLPTGSLNLEDQKKLAQAKGIVATPLNVREFVNLIDKGSNDLNVYCVWRLNCPACDQLLRSLTALKQEIEPDDLAIHHVNVNFPDEIDKVTAHIREMGLINNNYILTGLEDYENDAPYCKLLRGDLPLLFLVNNEEGIKLIYQKAFTLEELYALIAPLTI